MKKTLSLLLVLALCLSLCACGGSGDESAEAPATEATELPTTEAPTTEATEPAVEDVVYKLGDIIETDLFKITPNFTGYAKELANWPDENYMTPAGKFSGQSPYSAGEEKTAMYGEIQIEYIGQEKTNVALDIKLSVNYDDGYVFENDAVDYGYCFSLDGDWTYKNNMTFEPLSDKTVRILRYCVEVPEQVESNPDKALLVTVFVNEEAFVYDFRSSEVLGSDYDPRGELYQPADEATKAQIIAYLKENGLEVSGWYAGTTNTVGVYTFTFGDTSVNATLPINSDYAYEFSGTYEVFSGTILLNWDHGEQMALDYTFDGTTLDVVEFVHGK